MATKKQKREAALARRAEYMEKVKAEGLRALEADRARQKARAAAMKAAIEEINLRHQGILDSATQEDWEEARQAIDGQRKPKKKQTSFYSELQGRPVNAETFYSEMRLPAQQ